MNEISADESASKALYIVDIKEIQKLHKEEKLHPQTRKVLPTIEMLYVK